MKPNLFISYSRREVGFVDQLATHIEKQGYNLWLDYRSLVPGKPWEEHIYQGIMNSSVILLVVSKASIASDNVEFEWRRVLEEKNKRVILLIFEAVDLPPELEKFEWVDFRGDYQAALKEMDRQIQMEEEEEHPAPQTGFKVPSIVWLASGLSLVTAILSLGAAWTIFIPFFLLPLPYQIFKRSFKYLLVQGSLVMLPVALFLLIDFAYTSSIIFPAGFWVNDIELYNTDVLALISLPFAIALMLVLRSPAMQRWGKPEALSAVSFPHWDENIPEPQSVLFHIEHSSQDSFVANELKEALTAHGHKSTDDLETADATFTLISEYKNESSLDCEKHFVFPVILQTNNNVSRQLSRIQWMDLRLGFKNIDGIGKMLDTPEKLLRALCVRPIGNQLVLPRTILYLIYFIFFLAIVDIGSWFPYIVQYLPEIQKSSVLNGSMLQLTLSMLLFGAISYMIVRQIVARKGFFASYLGLILGFALFGAIIYWQGQVDFAILDILNIAVDKRGLSSFYITYLYEYGGLAMLVYLLFKNRDLRRWFPAN